MIFARKINKIPDFFARKMPEFYTIIAPKYFSRIFFFWGGHVLPCPRLPRLWFSISVSVRLNACCTARANDQAASHPSHAQDLGIGSVAVSVTGIVVSIIIIIIVAATS